MRQLQTSIVNSRSFNRSSSSKPEGDFVISNNFLGLNLGETLNFTIHITLPEALERLTKKHMVNKETKKKKQLAV